MLRVFLACAMLGFFALALYGTMGPTDWRLAWGLFAGGVCAWSLLVAARTTARA